LHVTTFLGTMSNRSAKKRKGGAAGDDDDNTVPLSMKILLVELSKDDVGWESIKLIVDQHPAALSTPDTSGKTPFHWICSDGNLPPGALRYLLECKPDGPRSVDDLGNLPLHCITASSKLQTVRCLHEEYPEAVFAKNHYGEIPLVKAASSGASPDVISFLTQKSPHVLSNPETA